MPRARGGRPTYGNTAGGSARSQVGRTSGLTYVVQVFMCSALASLKSGECNSSVGHSSNVVYIVRFERGNTSWPQSVRQFGSVFSKSLEYLFLVKRDRKSSYVVSSHHRWVVSLQGSRGKSAAPHLTALPSPRSWTGVCVGRWG